MSKKIFTGLLSAILASTIIIAAYIIFKPDGHMRTLDGYSIESVPAHTPLCGVDKIQNSQGKHIVTLQICEDNIESVSESDEFITITTNTGSVYKKNKTTGEETISNAGGFGGISIVKFSF